MCILLLLLLLLLLPPPPTTLTRSRFSSLPRPPTDLLFPSSPASPFARRSRACKTAKSVTRSHFLESLSPPLIVNHTHGVPLLFSFLSSLLLLFLAPLARFTRIDGGCTYRYATNNFIYSRTYTCSVHTIQARRRYRIAGAIRRFRSLESTDHHEWGEYPADSTRERSGSRECL